MRRLAFLVLVVAAACKKDEPAPVAVDAAAPVESAKATSTPPPAVDTGEPIEARRKKVTKLEDEPALVAASDALKKHYGGRVPKELSLQIAGRAVLVDGPEKPFAILVDATGAVRWTKERPAAGIMPPVGPLALAGGPNGRIALAVCDPPTTRVALRIWDDDGSPFADYDAMDMDDCTTLSLLYWPRTGWLIVATRPGTTKAQLVKENGSMPWRRGMEIGARSVTGAPASVAVDSDDSFVLVQYGALSAEPGARPHAVAFRYDVHGAPLWPSPADLGAAPVARIDDRIALDRPKIGVVHATLAKGVEADLTSNGRVTQRQ